MCEQLHLAVGVNVVAVFRDDAQPVAVAVKRQAQLGVAVGQRGDGRLLQLNSYENRVWQIGIEDSAPVKQGATVGFREEHILDIDTETVVEEPSPLVRLATLALRCFGGLRPTAH